MEEVESHIKLKRKDELKIGTWNVRTMNEVGKWNYQATKIHGDFQNQSNWELSTKGNTKNNKNA